MCEIYLKGFVLFDFFIEQTNPKYFVKTINATSNTIKHDIVSNNLIPISLFKYFSIGI